MAGFDFSVSTEGLQDKGKIIGEEAINIREALADIKHARGSLDAWISKNKDKYESKIISTMPKLEEMADVVAGYANVAKETANRIINVENKIAAAIDSDNDAQA